ncbi:MAG: deoxyribodipyrimidine photo-lyase, partial [Oleibacter sp.]|nr:deoxyribodipyrimidine photo-lyase [Thalassolituus sp.]
MLQIVWFKRDLRIHDHAAIAAAAARGPVICIYIFEAAYWQLPDTSQRQWDFIRESLEDLQQQLLAVGGRLQLLAGDCADVFQQLRTQCGPFELHSHEETGNYWTFQRDRAVKAWCKTQQIDWHEHPQFGVRRASKTQGRHNRDDWANYWHQFMHSPLTPTPVSIEWADSRDETGFILNNNELPNSHSLPMRVSNDPLPCPYQQHGGRRRALAVLESFMTLRGERYRGSISSPLTAESACSRLSPYLAYGCISMKEVVKRLADAQVQVSSNDLSQFQSNYQSKYWTGSLAAFESRLWWHCHFIQKLEDQPDMEWRNLHPAMASLQRTMNTTYFDAWQYGRTGWPMVDACMRYLHCHGWINFR